MPSYVNFRDVAAIIAAGGKLQTAGITLESRIQTDFLRILGREDDVISRRDEYGRTFWDNTYAAKDRRVNIYTQSIEWAKRAKTMGEDVVTAANQMLWIDAVSGAAIASDNVSA